MYSQSSTPTSLSTSGIQSNTRDREHRRKGSGSKSSTLARGEPSLLDPLSVCVCPLLAFSDGSSPRLPHLLHLEFTSLACSPPSLPGLSSNGPLSVVSAMGARGVSGSDVRTPNHLLSNKRPASVAFPRSKKASRSCLQPAQELPSERVMLPGRFEA